MNFPGSNTLSLCGAALCKIVEKHIADGSYTNKEGPVRVTFVRFDTLKSVAHFEVTTDQTEKEPSNG